MDSIMINWEERKIFCNTCGGWVEHSAVYINGTHDYFKDEISAHTVWEK